MNAVMTMLQAVVNGGGSMAQFSVPELGGSGQWMQGGMTMVGDMFNQGLQFTVSNLCAELSQLIYTQPIFEPAPTKGFGGASLGNWWPAELGSPNSSGSQNAVRYAYFAQSRRLVMDVMGVVSVFDTLDHQISGVSQQQGGGSSVQFSSQYGTVDTINLPLISTNAPAKVSPIVADVVESFPITDEVTSAPEKLSADTKMILDAIEQIASLHAKGILSDAEFGSKKAELLARL
jgi:hypothetical protein